MSDENKFKEFEDEENEEYDLENQHFTNDQNNFLDDKPTCKDKFYRAIECLP